MRALASGLLCGVLWLQSRAALPDTLPLIVMLLAALTLLAMPAACGLLVRHPVKQAVVLLIAAGLFGAGWAGLRAHQRLQQSLPAQLEGRDLRVIGEVRGLPDLSPTGIRFRFRPLEATLPDGERVALPSDFSLSWYAGNASDPPALRSGERWQLTVRLKRPHGLSNPGGFDAEAWMLNENIRATGYVRPEYSARLAAASPWWQAPLSAIDNLRAAVREKIIAALPSQPYASVVVALVIGDQRAVSQKDWDVFANTGIGHLVSISGLHITMISGLIAMLFHWLWRCSFFTRASLPLRLPAQKAAAAAGVVAALAYVALAGFGIPAQRTLLMIVVAGAALWSSRTPPVSQVLSVALLVVLLCDPWSVLWPGFWLSFFAIGCIIYASTGRAAADESVVQGGLLAKVFSNLCAAARTQWVVTLGLLPLSFAWFSQVSLISPIANAVAIPLVSFAITPLSLLGSLLPPPLSSPLLNAAHALMAWLADWLGWLARSPWAVWQAPQPDWGVFAMAVAGTLWALAPRGWPLRWAGLLAWLPLLLARSESPEQGFRVIAFDIGQGNALLVETTNHRLMYDTGPAFSVDSDSGSRVLLPYLKARGITALDALVISHSDLDHSGGARSLWKGVQVGWLSTSLPTQHPLLEGAPPHTRCRVGQSWRWDGVLFEMLHPDEEMLRNESSRPNARSCTLKITYRKQAVLLTGDIEAAQERSLLIRARETLHADVLLAPHHGSGTSSTEAFLDAVHPSAALFQLGYRNRYHHPKPEVVDRYRARGIQTLRTDQSGAVRIEVDESLRISGYRCQRQRYWSSEICDSQSLARSPGFASDRGQPFADMPASAP